MPSGRATLSLALLLGLISLIGNTHGADAIVSRDRAEDAYQRGDIQQAVQLWEQASAAARRAGDVAEEVRTAAALSKAYQALGQHRRAVRTLRDVRVAAEVSDDQTILPTLLAQLGSAFTLIRALDDADELLVQALEQANAQGNNRLAAGVLNDLGNLRALQSDYVSALEAYRQSANRARDAASSDLLVSALVNGAGCALVANNPQDAQRWIDEFSETIDALPDGHLKALSLLNIAQVVKDLPAPDTSVAQRLRVQSSQFVRSALELAEGLSDSRLESYALGYLAELYREDDQPDVALQLANRAIFAAQQAAAPEALYRWEWQVGRLLKDRGDTDAAIQAYQSAVKTLDPIRHDLSLGYGNRWGLQSFRESEGPLFFELADMLLQQARSEPNRAFKQQTLANARDTVELLKAVELEDYFSDECVDIQRSQTRTLEAVDDHTAVVYLIPLSDRTEIIVGLTDGLHQFEATVGAEELEEIVNTFRRNLETRTTFRYLAQSRQLYDWLIRPINELLEVNGVDTLVFVPDGALRTIPFAALHNGDAFLIQERAVAVVPGLSLVAPRPIAREQVRLLLNGLSDGVQDFPPLEHVSMELAQVEELYPSHKLFNSDYTLNAITRQMKEDQYEIVHIASHGEFNSDARKTFVLTYDTRLTLDDLESLIRPSQYRGQPVELLVLSACQTAAGDDRAALGLAGVAVKAGARSALATLWYVNDQSTSTVITEFYQNLRDHPNRSKAAALRAAQLSLLEDRRYRHPCYWAPYLIIGNWL